MEAAAVANKLHFLFAQVWEKLMHRRVLLATAIVLGFTFSSLVAVLAADFNGVWKGPVEFPDGTTRELTYTLKVDGDKLTGTIESQRGKIEISDGKITTNGFTFNTVRDGNTIAHEGKLEDGKIKITVHTSGGDREYTLSQAAAPASAAAKSNAPPADVNGKWEGKIKDESGNDIDLVYDFKVDGGKLTGTVEGPVGKLNIENGSIDGDKLKYQVSFGDFHIQHDAQVVDGKIKITSHVPMGDREYTVTRKMDLAGKWETKFTTPDGNEVLLKYDFKVDGDKLSGTVQSPLGVIDLRDGKINGNAISYKATVADSEVAYDGTYADGKIKIKSHGGPFGDHEYTLTRPASADGAKDKSASSNGSGVKNIVGAWEATFKDDAGNDMPLKFDLKLDGEKLTGTVKSPQGDGELSNGKVSGDQVSFEVEFGGETIKHKGSVSGDEIKLTANGFGTQWDLTLKRPAAK
jgi:hypothetical protein